MTSHRRWMPGAAILAAMLLAGCAATAKPTPSADPAAAASPVAEESTTPADAPSETVAGAGGGGQGDQHGTSGGDAGGTGTTTEPHEAGSQDPASPAPQSPATQPPAPGADTPPPPANGPTVAITSMACNGSGSFQKLRVQLTASYNTTYRQGINAVWLTRLDNLGTGWIAQTAATWAGQYAGRGDMWSGELLSRKPTADGYDSNPDYGKVLKVRVQVAGGQIWEFEHPIDRPC